MTMRGREQFKSAKQIKQEQKHGESCISSKNEKQNLGERKLAVFLIIGKPKSRSSTTLVKLVNLFF